MALICQKSQTGNGSNNKVENKNRIALSCLFYTARWLACTQKHDSLNAVVFLCFTFKFFIFIFNIDFLILLSSNF